MWNLLMFVQYFLEDRGEAVCHLVIFYLSLDVARTLYFTGYFERFLE